LWNINGQLIKETNATNDYLWGVDWSSDGNRIITTSQNGIITIWDSQLNFIQHIEY